jgi:hypothetical protein
MRAKVEIAEWRYVARDLAFEGSMPVHDTMPVRGR